MATDVKADITIRSATVDDIPAIADLIVPFVAKRQLLPRSHEDLSRMIANGFVAELDGCVIGCVGVEIYSKKLAELVCLAIAQEYQGIGIGRQLVERCIQRAREHNVYELMAITAEDSFFKMCGFDYSLPEQKRALFVHTRDESRS